jgi:hypothetical protein
MSYHWSISWAPWIQFTQFKSYFFNNYFSTIRKVRWKDNAKSPTNYNILIFPLLSLILFCFVCEAIGTATTPGLLSEFPFPSLLFVEVWKRVHVEADYQRHLSGSESAWNTHTASHELLLYILHINYPHIYGQVSQIAYFVPSDSPIKILYAFLICPVHDTCLSNLKISSKDNKFLRQNNSQLV